MRGYRATFFWGVVLAREWRQKLSRLGRVGTSRAEAEAVLGEGVFCGAKDKFFFLADVFCAVFLSRV